MSVKFYLPIVSCKTTVALLIFSPSGWSVHLCKWGINIPYYCCNMVSFCSYDSQYLLYVFRCPNFGSILNLFLYWSPYVQSALLCVFCLIWVLLILPLLSCSVCFHEVSFSILSLLVCISLLWNEFPVSSI